MGCSQSAPNAATEGANLDGRHLRLPTVKLLARVKGRRLTTTDIEVIWQKFKPSGTHVPGVEAEQDWWGKIELTDFLKALSQFNYGDSSVPPELTRYYRNIFQDPDNDRGVPDKKLVSRAKFEAILNGEDQDKEALLRARKYHPGRLDDEEYACCGGDDTSEGCTDRTTKGRRSGVLAPGQTVTIGPDWSVSSEPSEEVFLEMIRLDRESKLFGTVQTWDARRKRATVSWKFMHGGPVTYNFGRVVRGVERFDLTVVCEGAEDQEWRPLLTGGIRFLRKVVHKFLTPEQVQELWDLYDYNTNETWSMVELRSLLEDLREIQFGDRDVGIATVEQTVSRIKREAVQEEFADFVARNHGETEILDRIPIGDVVELVQILGRNTVPRIHPWAVLEDDLLGEENLGPFVTTSGFVKERHFVDWWLGYTAKKTAEQLTWHEFRVAHTGKRLCTGGVSLLRRLRGEVLTTSSIREIWKVYVNPDFNFMDKAAFSEFVADLHEILFGDRIVAEEALLGSFAFVDEDESGEVDEAEFIDYFKGFMLPDAASFLELRRDPQREEDAQLDLVLDILPTVERHGLEIDKIEEVVERNLARRMERAKRAARGGEVEELKASDMEREALAERMQRRHYLRQRQELNLGDVNPRNNGDKTGNIRPANWT